MILWISLEMALPSVDKDLSANRRNNSSGEQPYIKQGGVWDIPSAWKKGKCQVVETGWERLPAGANLTSRPRREQPCR